MPKLTTPFAIDSSLKNPIPQKTNEKGKASYTQGFPQETMRRISEGGVAPDGKDFNGLLYEITQQIVELNKGLAIQKYDDSYSESIGGYPLGARVLLNDDKTVVISTVANNQNNPNSNMTNWTLVTDDMIKAWTGKSQKDENKMFVTSCDSIDTLKNISIADGRTCEVTLRNGKAIYRFDSSETQDANDSEYISSNLGDGRWVKQSNLLQNNILSNHGKGILTVLPFCFDGYLDALAEWGYTDSTAYLYAGGFDVYEKLKQIYVAYTPSWKMETCYISVHDYTKQGSASCLNWFRLNNNSINEGLVITEYYGGLRLFSMQNATGVLFEYDITTTPKKGAFLTEVARHQTGGFNEFSFDEDNGLWYMESKTPPVQGSVPSRNNILVYDANFNLVNTLQLPLHASNYVTVNSSSQSSYIPKRQGFDVRFGKFHATYGAIHDGDTTDITKAQMQGSRVYSLDGSLLSESLHTPLKFRDNKRIHLNDPNIRRSEYEGCRVMSDGTVLGLMYNYGRANSYADRTEKGIVIFKEMDSGENAYDYASSSVNIFSPNLTNGWYLKRSDGNVVVNPFSGMPITTLADLCEVMRAGQIPFIKFSTSTISLTDLSGNTIPSELSITMSMVTYNNILVESQGISSSMNAFPTFTASYGSSGWKVRNTSPTTGGNIIMNGSYDGTTARNFLLSRNASSDNLISVIDQQCNNSAKNSLLVLGGGTGMYAGSTEVRIATSPDVSSLGGSTRWVFNASALFPYLDNTYSLGTGTRKVSVIYSNTGTINTSDAREKTPMRSVNDAEIAVAKQIMQGTGFFKFNESIEKKGDNDARWHYGVMAQDVIKAFTDNGLDWQKYAMICYDEWDAIPAEYDTDTKELLSPETPAGNRYGVRLDQLTFFCLSHLLS